MTQLIEATVALARQVSFFVEEWNDSLAIVDIERLSAVLLQVLATFPRRPLRNSQPTDAEPRWRRARHFLASLSLIAAGTGPTPAGRRAARQFALRVLGSEQAAGRRRTDAAFGKQLTRRLVA